MINTYIGKGLQGIQDWTQLANVLESSKTESVKSATVELENNIISITVNDGKTTHSVTISVPDLGKVEGVLDTEALKTLAADIMSVMASLSAIGESGPELSQAISKLQADLPPSVESGSGRTLNTINTRQALFDLYALMALMVQVAQKQRDATREVRQSESQQIQNSIQQQADDMREAAQLALIIGCFTSALSAAMSLGSILGQVKAFCKQNSATEQLQASRQDLKSANMLENPEVASANFKSVQTKTMQMKTVEAKVIESAAGEGAEGAGQDAEPEQKPPSVQEEALKGTPDAEEFKRDLADKRAAAKDAEKNEQAQQKELERLKGLEDSPANKEAVEAQEKKYQAACKATKKAKADCREAEREFFGKLDAKQQAYEAEIESKYGEIAAEEAKPGFFQKMHVLGAEAKERRATIARLRGEIGEIAKKSDYLRAYTTDLKASYASEEIKSTTQTAAHNNYHAAKSEVEQSRAYRSSQLLMNSLMGSQQVITNLSQMINSIGNKESEDQRAEATLEGAQQARHNEQLEQIKDLFTQAETLIQAVIQLMQAVAAAENESMMEAIRA